MTWMIAYAACRGPTEVGATARRSSCAELQQAQLACRNSTHPTGIAAHPGAVKLGHHPV